MWFVSKLPFRQTLVVLGTPGNGVAEQSANAQSPFGISSRASSWWTRRVSVAPALLVLTASYEGGVVMFTVLAAALRMYSARMRLTNSVPFLFFATGMRTCRPVATSPSQPLSERTYPFRCRKPSPRSEEHTSELQS